MEEIQCICMCGETAYFRQGNSETITIWELNKYLGINFNRKVQAEIENK